MEWKYSAHAVERMLKRGISVAEVEKVLSFPDGKIQQSKDKWICFKHLSNRSDNKIAVVSVLFAEPTSLSQGEVLTVMNFFKEK